MTFYHFSVGGTWQRPTVWTINIYRDRFIFYWVFLDGRRKISKQKPHTSFNRRLFVAKKPEGTWQRPRKMLKKLFYKGGTWQRGNMTKGEYGKGYYGNIEANL